MAALTRLSIWLEETLCAVLLRRRILSAVYTHGHRPHRLAAVQSVRSQRRLLLTECEAVQLISAVEAAQRVPGELAEVGVAYGGSARLLGEHAQGKTLHLFDTFRGLPAPLECDSNEFTEKDYACALEEVRAYLGSSAVFHAGLFPQETGADVADLRFSFVHLDVDLYRSTLDSLHFFYPRMSPGGVILAHDFPSAEGVRRAFEEFFADLPEPVIELVGRQCMVVKLA
jgi:O-methyltransferase